MLPPNSDDQADQSQTTSGGTRESEPTGETAELTEGSAARALAGLYTAYIASHAKLTFDQFRDKMLKGVALWEDLDLGLVERVLPQLSTLWAGLTLQRGPIRTNQIQTLLNRLLTLTMEDGLTGLFNRRYFDHRLTQELQRARREQAPCSVMLVDIDDFKRINDRFGHDVGDRMLRHISGLLQGTLRASDEVTARFGGEEFAIILPSTGARQAPRVAERLRARVVAAPVPCAAEETITLSVSVGVSTARPADGLTAEQLVKQADRALYEAKNAGKNAVRCFHDGQDEEPEGVSTAEREALLG